MKWDYKIINVVVDETIGKTFNDKKNRQNPIDNSSINMINNLGKEDWELVSVVPYTVSYGQTQQFIFSFKRPHE